MKKKNPFDELSKLKERVFYGTLPTRGLECSIHM